MMMQTRQRQQAHGQAQTHLTELTWHLAVASDEPQLPEGNISKYGMLMVPQARRKFHCIESPCS